MYSKIPLIQWVRDQTGTTLPNIPDYQTPPILIISIYHTLVRAALMYRTERHILSNYKVQNRKKNGEWYNQELCQLHQILSEQLQQQGFSRLGTNKEWAKMK
jgi:hypothetical protein